MVPRFFEGLRDYSEIKLRLLGKFLPPWSAKLGQMVRNRNRIIWYVDGFAGEGKYKDGSDGSPVLGLRRAKHIHTANQGYELKCFFVEKALKRWKVLEELTTPFRRDGIDVVNRRGEFSSAIPEIVQVTSGAPILLFVDPFGLSPLKYHQFAPLLRRGPPLDLILTFQHKAVHRLAKTHPSLISEAIGDDEWLQQWSCLPDPKSQTELVLEIFRKNILADGRFLEVFYYPIRPTLRSAPKYYLLLASRHPDAFELWNDQVSREEDTLTQKEYERVAVQASFFPEFDAQNKGMNLLRDIREFGRQKGTTTRQDIIMFLVTNRCGEFHTREIKKAVASLVGTGEVLRDGGKAINTVNLFFK